MKHRQFDSFGNIVSDTAPVVSKIFAFTGKMFDITIGLQRNINRWYDPLIGQWISEDPIGCAGGDENQGSATFTVAAGVKELWADAVVTIVTYELKEGKASYTISGSSRNHSHDVRIDNRDIIALVMCAHHVS